MRLSILMLAAVASATRFAERDSTATYPSAPVLPVPSYNSASDGFNSLASIYSDGAGKLSSQADAIAKLNVALNGSSEVQYKYDLKIRIFAVLAGSLDGVWSTAYNAEKKVCSIVTSINQQNVENVKGSLRASIIAQTEALTKVATVIAETIANAKAQIDVFTEAEKAIISAFVAALAKAILSSIEPATELSAGLAATGTKSISGVVQGLQNAGAGIQAVAKNDWSTSPKPAP